MRRSFLRRTFWLNAAYGAVKKIAGHTKGKNILAFVGMPLTEGGKLYNTAAAVNDGKVIGFTTKTFLPNYGEFYEMRQFTPGPDSMRWIQFDGEKVPFGPKILFQDDETADLIVGAEICEDVWSPVPPSIEEALAGATIIVNCSARCRNGRKRKLQNPSDRRSVRAPGRGICLCERGRRRVNDGSRFRRT